MVCIGAQSIPCAREVQGKRMRHERMWGGHVLERFAQRDASDPEQKSAAS